MDSADSLPDVYSKVTHPLFPNKITVGELVFYSSGDIIMT